jgi:hypothetical protein
MHISLPIKIALLAIIATLAVSAPAGARPIDADRPAPSVAPSSTPSRGGGDPWVVPLAAVLAFAAGVGAATLAPTLRLRVRPS